MRHFVDNVELYLTAAGLAVILVVPAALDLGTDTLELAVAATLVGVLHGMIFWTLRRRQRRLRREMIHDIRATLRTRIQPNLDRLLAHVRPPDRALSEEDRDRLGEVARAVQDVSAAVDAVSAEALSRAGRPPVPERDRGSVTTTR